MNLKSRAIAPLLMTQLCLLSSLGLSSCAALPLRTSEPELVSLSELAIGDQTTAAIDRLVTDSLWDNGPGVAVLILNDGEIWQKGYGFSNVLERRPITPDTVFDLASVSKQMTAMGILILMEAGELALEDAVSDHVPDFVDPNPDDPILITDLLYHTSGLADYTGGAWEGTDEEFARLTVEDHLQWLNEQETEGDRGVEFEYNNSGYALLALIIERVSGQSFAEFMADQIFIPLGMNDTLVFTELGQRIPNQAEGYIVSKKGNVNQSTLPSVIVGDGNIFSSVIDLARYDQALRNGDLVDAETLELAFTPGALDDGETFPYGLGWEVSEDYVEHSGGWYGTSTFYRHYTEMPLTIIVLSNDENYEVNELVDNLAELLR
ncbi:serine hydrolase domain-containing protein [Spirulina sp. CCNP1310]|uniref:serine hydrolase domain-containing protein n=1 Tax=Spirulina sp. CCNP1310 TaxID=3110249 RepID=UPI002B2025EA|nr:serine hydrolase domain-containing protein [Spirulina sp. CCNP1310]MEA5419073.1 serine hydrolase domain-containing protein [Spirulina sp. CCNP1310]